MDYTFADRPETHLGVQARVDTINAPSGGRHFPLLLKTVHLSGLDDVKYTFCMHATVPSTSRELQLNIFLNMRNELFHGKEKEIVHQDDNYEEVEVMTVLEHCS